MDRIINKLDEVWTADNKLLGLAHSVHHRVEGVNPDLELYAGYLEVENFELGYVYYVPFEFIREDELTAQPVRLSVTFDKVLKKTWSRMPHFIAHGEGREEALL